MALVLFDRVKETSNTSGTGTIVLAGAVTGYQSFAVVGNANTTYYTIADQTGANWEVGIGTYYTGNVSLARTTILASSNANAVVNFTNATHDVFITYPAEKSVNQDATGNVSSYKILNGTIDNAVIGGTTPAAGTFTTITGQTEVLTGTGQNLLTYSNTFTNAVWTKSALAAATTVATTDPTGGSNAYIFTADGTTAPHYISGNGFTAGPASRTWSVYLKAGTNNFAQLMFGADANPYANFNLSTGVVGNVGTSATASIVSVGSGWYRCIVTTTSTTATNPYICIVSSNTAVRFESNALATTIYSYGGQYELASTAGTYLATTTTAVYGTPTLSFSGVANVTLDSSGTMNLSSGGSSGFNFLNNATNYVSVSKNFTLNEWDIVASNTSNLGLVATGGGGIQFYTATGGVSKQFAIPNTGSAVNYVQATGGTTGNAVTISAQGSDTNVSINLTPKGTGYANITSGGIKFPDGSTQASAALAAAGNSSIGIFNTNITANATISAGTNGLSVGPVNTANGVTVTVAANSTWITL